MTALLNPPEQKIIIEPVSWQTRKVSDFTPVNC